MSAAPIPLVYPVCLGCGKKLDKEHCPDNPSCTWVYHIHHEPTKDNKFITHRYVGDMRNPHHQFHTRNGV